MDLKIQLDDRTEKGSKLLQYVAAAAANLCIIAAGTLFGWTSPVLVKLEENPVSPYNPIGSAISKDESSLIGSFMTVGAICGSLVAGWMSEKFGRKRSLLFTALPYTIGWFLIATASSILQFYIARLVFGFAIAINVTIVPMYCGEIAETSIRGALGTFVQLFSTIGLVYAYATGPFVSYTTFWMLCGAVPVVFFICFMFMPESPYYLLSQGMKTEAQESLAKFRGKSANAVQTELEEMLASVQQAYSTKVTLSDLVTVKANFKALLITCMVISFQQLSGITFVLFYAQSIFNASGTTVDPAICTIIIGIVQVAASSITPVVVDKLGRRILLIVSSIGSAIGTGVLGVYFFLKEAEQSSSTSKLGWLPISSLIFFMCFYCVGLGPLPFTIMGEMFSSEVKAKASGITILVGWSWSFVMTKFFINVVISWGTYSAFWIFTICCIISAVFTVMFLPETKGKSLQQIQDELSGVKLLVSNTEELKKMMSD